MNKIQNDTMSTIFGALILIIVGPITTKWIPYIGEAISALLVLLGVYIIACEIGRISKLLILKKEKTWESPKQLEMQDIRQERQSTQQPMQSNHQHKQD